jgi:ATP-dependent RNA helicase DDX55/SPB4
MNLQKNTVDILPKLKSMALADRAMFEKGMKAFVSHVQAYAKHECSLIFRLKGECFLSAQPCKWEVTCLSKICGIC